MRPGDLRLSVPWLDMWDPIPDSGGLLHLIGIWTPDQGFSATLIPLYPSTWGVWTPDRGSWATPLNQLYPCGDLRMDGKTMRWSCSWLWDGCFWLWIGPGWAGMQGKGFTWRNRLGYPAQTGLISLSVCLSVCLFIRPSGIWKHVEFLCRNSNQGVHVEFSVHSPSPPNTYSYVREENLGSTRKFVLNCLLFMCISNLILAIHTPQGTFLRQRRKVPPAHAQRVYLEECTIVREAYTGLISLSVCPSVCLSVRLSGIPKHVEFSRRN